MSRHINYGSYSCHHEHWSLLFPDLNAKVMGEIKNLIQRRRSFFKTNKDISTYLSSKVHDTGLSPGVTFLRGHCSPGTEQREAMSTRLFTLV